MAHFEKKTPSNLTSCIKNILPKIIGKNAFSWVHAVRFAYDVRTGRRKEPEVEILKTLLPAGSIAIDVGASGADWCFYLAKRVGFLGKVFAFEADPHYAYVTSLTCKILGLASIQMFNYALSDRCAVLPLRVCSEDGSPLYGRSCIDNNATPDNPYVKWIDSIPLDMLIRNYPELKKTALIKIDVEGYEKFVIEGAMELIRTARPVIILETGHESNYSDSNCIGDERLVSLGYKAGVYTQDKKITIFNIKDAKARSMGRNIIMIPEEKKDIIDKTNL